MDAENLKLKLLLADAADVQPVAGGFDLVLIAYMHPEPADRPAVFAVAAQAVAPGGQLAQDRHARVGAAPEPAGASRWAATRLACQQS